MRIEKNRYESFFIKEPLVLFFMENIRKPYQIFSTLEKDGTKTKRKHDKVNEYKDTNKKRKEELTCQKKILQIHQIIGKKHY